MKSERVQLRLDARSKRKLERAAAFSEQTVTDFVLSNALDAADRMLAEHEVVTLSDPDWEIFLDALVNPPVPNPALESGFRWYREHAK
jgi:uncharacterized protein (DUF1778 family)